MDNTDETKSFFKHVFNFDDDSKSDILNILQYSLIAIIPIVILNKSIQKYIPEADDKKSSLEISAEVIIQVIVMFMGLLMIHRIVTFIPTYSGAKYPEYHVIFNVLATLMVVLSLQTKLGEKVSILIDRIVELWNGKKEEKKGKKNGAVKVSQPISGQQMSSPMTDGTAISSLPDYQTGQQTQTMPNYDNMYRQDTTPLVGAATPGMENMSSMDGPVAANSLVGGAFGSTW